MHRQRWVIGGLAVLLMGGAAAAGLWNWVLGPTEGASAPITALPLSPSDEGTLPPVGDSSATERTILEVDPDNSEVRFILTEELRGEPATVVGTSNQVAGQIAVAPGDLSSAQVGVIQVNARTLATDQDRRNQAIRNQILNTDEFELITFVPTEIRGLSGSAAVGDTLAFQIVGDLTIRDITQSVVFDVTVTVDSPDQISGTAATTVERSDFGLTIPSVPFVANVGQQVRLEIDFVAAAA